MAESGALVAGMRGLIRETALGSFGSSMAGKPLFGSEIAFSEGRSGWSGGSLSGCRNARALALWSLSRSPAVHSAHPLAFCRALIKEDSPATKVRHFLRETRRSD